ncbi:MAG: hypothetical protein B6245_02150 [Desulfobacteraceae bacterium 4572_88]|nr:MAG: hypothetical protein B6245_02150 [Desulfobacteraceae bacterium 4572_88]RLC18273.1 MAG: hypothetical protein DRI57_08665 [Deltaproteobacteria bacterium]
MKKILWVEDNADSVRNWDIFERNLSDSDLKQLAEMEARGDDFEFEIKPFLEKKNIVIEENFSGSCKRIFEEVFDIIIFDVRFSTDLGNSEAEENALEQAKALFIKAFPKSGGDMSALEDVFDEIQGREEYSGLFLFYLSCLHYENRKRVWALADIKTKICFFSGHSIGPDDFETLLGQYDALKWNPQIGDYCKQVKANFWSKNDKDGLDKLKAFIEKDPYLDILEQHLGKAEKELFAKVLKARDDETQIETNLHKLRIIQEKILKKLANDVHLFQNMRNQHLRDGNLNVRGCLRWLNDNPDSFYVSQDDVRDWDALFGVLKFHSDAISKRIYDFLDYRSQKRVSDWINNQDIKALKRFIIRDLNAIIKRKDFFFCDLVPQEYWKNHEYDAIRHVLNKGFFLSDFEYKKLNRFFIDRILSQTIRKRETYFDDVHYHLALSIHAIGSEAAHGTAIKQRDVLHSMIYAMRHIILRFGELCG